MEIRGSALLLGSTLMLVCVARLAAGADLFDTAKHLARTAPAEALAMLPRLERTSDRAQIQRLAILTAASIDRKTAARELPALFDAPWVGDVLFADAVGLAPLLGETDGRKLALLTASRHPDAALQNWALFARLPYADDILTAAALRAPDEAVDLLAADSPYSELLRDAFARIADLRMQRLLALGADRDLPGPLRWRLAFLAVPLEVASDDAQYFHALAEARLAGGGELEIDVLDRALSRHATELAHTYQQAPASAPEIAAFQPRDLYLLLAYSRAGDEDTYFARLFDRLAASQRLTSAIRDARYLRLREFVEYTLWFQRYTKFLNSAGSDASAASTLSQLFHGLELDSALTAADAIGFTPESVRRHLRVALAGERPLNSEQIGIRQALQKSLSRPLNAPSSLPVSKLAAPSTAILERYFFYDDADGLESFENFRAQYAHDPAWRWEERGGWVRLTSRTARRSIEIVGNRPSNAQQAVNAYLGEREPTVIVHRGHAYHVEKTLSYLTRSTRLVYLGSCRGLGEIRSVIDASPQADIISTRAVGTKRVNDPLLKMLNQALLGGGDIAWPSFWANARQRFTNEGDFAGYIPPNRNGAAAFMRTFDTLR